MVLTAIASAYLYAQSNAIYKCVNQYDQISYSQQPCKRGEKASVVKQSSNATRSSTGIAIIDQARQARTPPPAFTGECADQVNNLKVKTDQDLYSLAEQHRTQTREQARVAKQLEEARDSLVGEQWRTELDAQRAQISTELQNIETVARQIVEAEAVGYQNLRGRCSEAAAK